MEIRSGVLFTFCLAAVSSLGCAVSELSYPRDATVPASPDGGRPVPACVPGMSIACACPDATGAQVCGADGTYGACLCRSQPDGGAPSVDTGSPPAPDAGGPATPDLGPDAGPVPGPCGPGTTSSDAGCIPLSVGEGGLTYFDLRSAVDTVPGDGFTMLPLLALGREADGRPSTREVVFSVSRVGAGNVTPSARLTAAGITVNFVPCNAARSAVCAGPVDIVMYLASDPTTPVASRTLRIVDQAAVGTPAACLGGGNLAAVTGDAGDYISGGRSFTWRGTAVTMMHVSPNLLSGTLGTLGDGFRIELSTRMLGAPLDVGVFEDAVRYPFERAGSPAFSLSGMGRGCNTLRARFQIHELASDAQGLVSVLLTFEQHCEGGTPAARGCVRWQRP